MMSFCATLDRLTPRRAAAFATVPSPDGEVGGFGHIEVGPSQRASYDLDPPPNFDVLKAEEKMP